VKSIQKAAEQDSGDPFLIALSDRARAVQESFEDRQLSTADALAGLIKVVEKNEQRKRQQGAKGLDSLTYYLLTTFTDAGLSNPETVSSKVAQAFNELPNWRRSESELKDLRKKVTFAVFAEENDVDRSLQRWSRCLGFFNGRTGHDLRLTGQGGIQGIGPFLGCQTGGAG